jgi:hypothetical protein
VRVRLGFIILAFDCFAKPVYHWSYAYHSLINPALHHARYSVVRFTSSMARFNFDVGVWVNAVRTPNFSCSLYLCMGDVSKCHPVSIWKDDNSLVFNRVGFLSCNKFIPSCCRYVDLNWKYKQRTSIISSLARQAYLRLYRLEIPTVIRTALMSISDTFFTQIKLNYLLSTRRLMDWL